MGGRSDTEPRRCPTSTNSHTSASSARASSASTESAWAAAQQPRATPWEKRNVDVPDNADLKDGLKLVWFATGTDDFLLETTLETVKVPKHNFDVTYNETEGGHTWINWRERYLPEFAPAVSLVSGFQGIEARGGSTRSARSGAPAARSRRGVTGKRGRGRRGGLMDSMQPGTLLGMVVLLVLGACGAQSAELPQVGKSPTREVVAAMTREEKVDLVVGAGMDLPFLPEERQGPRSGRRQRA